jgi:hypothetical protein
LFQHLENFAEFINEIPKEVRNACFSSRRFASICV